VRVGVTRRRDWLVGQLPVGMLDDDFFVRFTSLFEDLATSLLEGADNIENLPDATVTPVPFIGWLGSWVGIHSVDSSMDEGLQRRLVRQASQGLAWRGTRAGLEQFLEVITGAPATVEESGGILREGEAGDRTPFVRVRVSSIGGLSVEDFIALVSDEIPANVAYALFLGQERLWPRPTDVNASTAALPAREGFDR
jgi:phage tail-like protein